MKTLTQEIVLQQVEKNFPKQKESAISSLSLTLKSGSIIGLVGPDGAGKTTLLRMLSGLLIPTMGEISVMGFNPVSEQNELRNYLGYMPQRFGLYEDLSVIENLNLFAELRGINYKARRQMFEKLLTFTDLIRFTHRLAGRLSGGMKQKLGLACTLLGDPKVLLLDEPGVGVDPISRQELWRMVNGLANSGMLILWSTSYLDEAERCPTILLLDKGKLLFEGVPQQLTDNMNNRCFLLSSEISHRTLMQKVLLLPQVSDAVIQGHFVRLILRKDATANTLPQDLGGGDYKLTPVIPRFEDAYIDLLGGTEIKESALAKIMQTHTGNPNETMIEAVELTKKFGNFAATDHVNFQVKRGEIFGLLGPNGAGKSTTFKMMCGLLTPTSGKALVLGLDFKTSPTKARAHLGYMAQRFSLYDSLTVMQNLQFFSGIYGLTGRNKHKKIQEMIDVFNFKPILNHAPSSLSLGFKQRLALACSLMHRPDILFLDEPTSGVDPITRREFWLHINGMVDKGVTVLVTTHFMEEAEYCDRVGLMFRGKMIALDKPEQLKMSIVTKKNPNPTMEDVFIELIQNYEEEEK